MLSFKWRHFKQDILLMLVRWYLAYSLSYTNKAGIDTINLHLALLFMLGVRPAHCETNQITEGQVSH
jgi:hypothetical protein